MGVTPKKEVLTKRQQEILQLLEKEPLSGIQIAGNLKDAPSIRMIQLEMKKLERRGFVKKEGEGRSTNWIIIK